jgi:hypothetical protein
MKFSPLNLFRFIYHTEKSKGIKYVPQYIFSREITQWLAVYRDKQINLKYYKQIIFQKGKPSFFLVGLVNEGSKEKLYSNLLLEMFSKKCIVDINAELPTDFADRIIVTGEKNIIITKSQHSASQILNWYDKSKHLKGQLDFKTKSYEKSPNIYENLTTQFLWSDSVWQMYAIKIWFEFLAQHKGSEFCMQESFQVLQDKFLNFKIKEVSEFNKVILDKDLRFLDEMSNYSTEISFLTDKSISLSKSSIPVTGNIYTSYEIKNRILEGEVQIGFCPKVKIKIELKNQDIENDFFYTVYNYEDDSFLNLKLSEKWEDNRFLLFTHPENDLNRFSHFSDKFKKIIPIKE